MRIYWSTKTIPELAELPPSVRKEAWKVCNNAQPPLSWYHFVLGLCTGIGAGIGVFVFCVLVWYGWASGSRVEYELFDMEMEFLPLPLFAFITVGIVVGVILGFQAQVHLLRPCLKMYLETTDDGDDNG